MLEQIKEYIEKRLEQNIDAKDLLAALEDAKSNITCNHLLLGLDVTAKEFINVLTDCVETRLKQNERRDLLEG